MANERAAVRERERAEAEELAACERDRAKTESLAARDGSPEPDDPLARARELLAESAEMLRELGFRG